MTRQGPPLLKPGRPVPTPVNARKRDVPVNEVDSEPRWFPYAVLAAVSLLIAGVAVPQAVDRGSGEAPPQDVAVADDDIDPAVVEEAGDDDSAEGYSGVPVSQTDPWFVTPLKVWGFNDAMRKYNKESIYGRYFYARRDQVLTGARLFLDLNDEEPLTLHADIKALQISLNDEVVHTISRKELLEGPRELEINFDPLMLTDENEFVLTFIPFNRGPCQPIVAPGVWSIIAEGQLDTRAEQLPLPNDLGMLPVPFFDQRTDREPQVQVVFVDPINPMNLHAGAMVASYFGIQTGAGGVRFPVWQHGELPEGHAVVLATNAGLEGRVDLPRAAGPAIRMIDHPGIGQANYKLLLVQGRDNAELKLAAEQLTRIAWGTGPYVGPELDIDEAFLEREEERSTAVGYPDWFVTERETRFADVMTNEDSLTHRGHAGDTLRFEFRISPQLLAEPAEFLIMDLEYLQRLPSPYTPAKLDVEFNGIFVETLPKYGGGEHAEPHVEEIVLPRDQLKGANRLQVHVSALQHEPLCVSDSWKLVENTVTGESTLRLVGETEMDDLPDVEMFVYTGLPYTLKPFLGNTAFVLPVLPESDEISTVLSVISNFAGATGRTAREMVFLPESVFDEEEGACLEDLVRPGDCERNLLMVGAVSNSTLLRTWSPKMPLSTDSGQLWLHPRNSRDTTLELLRAEYSKRERDEVALFIREAESDEQKFGAVMEFESPAKSGRTALVITANTPDKLPAIIDLQGYTEERREGGGDLLLLSGEKRAIYRLGPDYSETELTFWPKAWFFVVEHWVLLILATWLSALLLGWFMRNTLQRREAVRLALAEDDA